MFVNFSAGWDRRYPRTLPELWSYLIEAIGEDGVRVLQPALHDQARRIEPGTKITGLLIFTAHEGTPKSLLLDIAPIQTREGDIALGFSFDRKEVK